MNLSNRLRKSLAPLRGTPLHPQWLVLRGQQGARNRLAELATGVVLDIGCGDRWSEHFVASCATYVGFDYPTTVGLGYRGGPDVFGDARQLPVQDQSVDTILLLDVLEHLPDPEAALAEAARALKAGGLLILQVPFLYPLHDEPYDFQRWTVHGLLRLLDRQGLRVRERDFHGQPSETAAALAAIGLAKAVLDGVSRRSLTLLLAPLLLIGIPLVNVLGWLLARLLPNSPLMPLGYRVIAVKPE